MLRAMPAPRPQPRTSPPPLPRRKARAPALRPAVVAVQRHRYALPDVRELPRRVAGGPWEAGW
jgi:hypothetical protein